jgi:hypothetical protein
MTLHHNMHGTPKTTIMLERKTLLPQSTWSKGGYGSAHERPSLFHAGRKRMQ